MKKTIRRGALGSLALLVFAVIAIGGYGNYLGSTASFLAFNGSYLLLIALTLQRPRIYTYTFLATFLFLGFWVKFMVHMWLTYPFIEAIGKFSGSSSEWTASLWFASAGAAGVALGRIVHLLVRSGANGHSEVGDPTVRVPGWYLRHRRAIWVAFFCGSLLLCVLNWHFSIYRIGIASDVIFPLHGNAAGAWLVTLGGAMFLAVLAGWELSLSAAGMGPLLAIVIEAFAATVSMLSRSAYLFRVAPWGLVLAECGGGGGAARSRKAFALIAIAGFALSLAVVSVLRMTAYPPEVISEPTVAPVEGSVGSATPGRVGGSAGRISTKQRATWALLGLRHLPIDRWVGLEGVLVVTASGDADWRLLRVALREDPKAGMGSLYQQMARPAYQRSSKFVFLTLPGLIGFLAYSGSLWFTVLGAFLITIGALAVEEFIGRGFQSSFLSALVAANLAYRIVQLTYPYLLAVFAVELLAQCLFMWIVIWIPSMGSLRLKGSTAW